MATAINHLEELVSYFVGLDVSLDETAICIVDDAGDILKEGKAETEPEAIVTWLGAAAVPIERLGLEAGPLSPWLCEGLQAAGLPAVCIETRRMKGATAVMAVKTDRNDARAIAQAMRVGWYHPGSCEDGREPGAAAPPDQSQDLADEPGCVGKRNPRYPHGVRPEGRPRVDRGV